jgi:2-phosphosulfolactate phosphatase
MVADLFGQADFGVRLDWGPAGATAVHADVCVVVDVLSFSTSVTVAVGRGMRVFPHPWRNGEAQDFAAQHDAALAVGRLDATRHGAMPAPSLSPANLLACQAIPRLVLPSPNGSTIAATMQDSGAMVVAGCVRNAGAVAAWLASAIDRGSSIAVIPAGERWGSDGSLRPALEDQLGAGAILAELAGLGYAERFSPEAQSAVELYDAAGARLAERLYECVSGRELTSRGFGSDVAVAAELNASSAVPLLVDGAFQNAIQS